MDIYSESTDRGPIDYMLFALGFIGFWIAAAGLVVSSPIMASLGAVLFVLVVAAFRCTSEGA